MSLLEKIKMRIGQNGPLNVADYMFECLMHPTLGYYATRDPFGAGGDFITAPEISQMFGELIGLSLAQTWMDQGSPPDFTLAELGPGRGTLMADILRATARVPGFATACEVVLIEASPYLRKVQQETLTTHEIRFLDSAEALPERPLFIYANEFFDALPIRQFIRSGAGWQERHIGLAQDTLVFGLGPQSQQPALRARVADTKEGDIVEYAPAYAPIIDAVSTRIETHGGAGLVIDYGDWRSLGDTLQALSAHEPVGVLDLPGQCDLTAHVDFEALADATRCAHTRLTPQGVFLERLGITQRAQALAAKLSGQALNQHIQAHRRLTHPDEMGNLFKVLGLFPSGKAPPVGLDR